MSKNLPESYNRISFSSSCCTDNGSHDQKENQVSLKSVNTLGQIESSSDICLMTILNFGSRPIIPTSFDKLYKGY